ncbi:MAG TPA: dipeptide ABC transporter ATP-binding protein, partial [Burkholderiales bacterium]|nr:dipeptide ABC transporter ATP-binding protein [Burkholderiales bacterium]
RAVELLRRTGIPEPERRFHSYPHQLSGGQRQRAMIAMALACRPKLLIADEPTTALDVTVQAQILELLRDLQREFGMTVVLITHDLNMVRQFAERVGVMHRGKLVEVGATEDIFEKPQHDYTRALLASRPQRMIDALPADAPVVAEARGLGVTFDISKGWFGHKPFHAVRELNLQLRRGETLGVVGESGSGKTTLGLSLLRLLRSSGEIMFEGQRIDGMDQRSLRPLRKNMQIVFQDPFSSLSPRRTIDQIISEGLALHYPEDSEAERKRRVVEVLNEVGLDQNMLGRYPHEFSGGQRQRIAIARAVVLKPKLIVLDEPTSALDASVQRQVLELLVQLQRDHGLAYLFITHNLALIDAIAHQVIVMKDGAVVEAGEAEAVLSAPSHAYTRELLSAAALAAN